MLNRVLGFAESWLAAGDERARDRTGPAEGPTSYRIQTIARKGWDDPAALGEHEIAALCRSLLALGAAQAEDTPVVAQRPAVDRPAAAAHRQAACDPAPKRRYRLYLQDV